MPRDEEFAQARIPSWNGNPESWETYRDEVRIWLLGVKVDVDYCLAARLVSQLRGPARRIGLAMTDDELSADPPAPPAEEGQPRPARTRAQSVAGINRLLSRLESLAPQMHQRRGTYMREFFKEERYARRPGERLTDWLPRWDLGLERLRRDGVDLAGIDDLSGWYFLEHARLGETRLELVRTSIQDPAQQYHLGTLRQIVLRLFPHVHTREGRSHATSFSRQRQVYEAHAESEYQPAASGEEAATAGADDEEWYEYDPEGFPAPGEGDEDYSPEYLADALQTELDTLAADLDESADYEYGDGLTEDEQHRLDEAAATLAGAGEALEVVRALRQRLRTGKGRGGRGGRGRKGSGPTQRPGGKGIVPTSPPRGKGGRKGKDSKGKGKGKASDQRGLAERKARSHCRICGRIGHWAGDPECPRRNEANLVEEADEEEYVDEGFADTCVVHVLPLRSFAILESASAWLSQGSGHPDHARAIIDTACARSVAGSAWTKDYLQLLDTLGLRQKVREGTVQEQFRFGDGRVVNATRELFLPAVVCGVPRMIRCCEVPGNLSLLLGRDFLEDSRAEISYARRALTISGVRAKLESSHTGHLALQLSPQSFRSLVASARENPGIELPRALRGRNTLHRAARALTALAACCAGKTVLAPQHGMAKVPQTEAHHHPCASSVCVASASAPLGCTGPGGMAAPRLGPSVGHVPSKTVAPSPAGLGDPLASDGLVVQAGPGAALARGGVVRSHACLSCGGPGAYACTACGAPTCSICASGTLCARCSGGFADQASDHEGSEMVPQAPPLQHQEWRKMKPGTVAQLAAGMRSAETVHRHNITGQRVRDALVTQAVSNFTRRSRNAAAGTKGNHVLHEYCCERASALGASVARGGGQVRRWGLWNADLRQRSDQDMVLSSICKDLAHGRVVTLWASLPCTPWCAYHRMNNKNPAYDARLRKARSESLVLLRGFLRIVKDLRGFARRDRLRIAFEWPRHNDGWNLPVVRSLLRLLPYSARPDGCMYGMARQKPWRIATDFPLLVHRLARRCDRSHAHNRSQRIGETALYSTRFADAVARELVLRTARPQGGESRSPCARRRP